jgi:hypothetical protein
MNEFDIKSYGEIQERINKQLREDMAKERETGKTSEDLKRIRAIIKEGEYKWIRQ